MVKQIDNTDSRLIYSGLWESLNGQQGAYNGTLSLSTHAGDTTSVNFDGISITVTGNVIPPDDRQPTPKSSYAIDGAPSFFTFAPSSPLKSEFRKTFFTSKGLQRGTHKLLITNLVDNAPFLIDYITVTEGKGWWPWWGKGDPSKKMFGELELRCTKDSILFPNTAVLNNNVTRPSICILLSTYRTGYGG
ncbi:hypothetical protein NLJ89_g10780 [Agrocybe chaxingu]|uniref:Uncharacterized protein n=1 Tax=Agrocybe chaxingu TaxID=84603 RepID=A0A9W8MRT3_9AGAR|nr:hypothetical protein NLJ89_g10780 [Agrocybe chaxingu]